MFGVQLNVLTWKSHPYKVGSPAGLWPITGFVLVPASAIRKVQSAAAFWTLTPSWMYKEDTTLTEQEEKSLFELGSSFIFTLLTAQCFICHGGGKSVPGPARCGRPPAGRRPTSNLYHLRLVTIELTNFFFPSGFCHFLTGKSPHPGART